MDVDKVERMALQICEFGRTHKDTAAFTDAMALIHGIERTNAVVVTGEDDKIVFDDRNFAIAHKLAGHLRGTVGELIRLKQADSNMAKLYHQTLIFDAPYNFDCFCRAIEFNQTESKRFYAPRRNYLKPFVQGYQDILDGKLDLLTVSMPKRSGKSQTGILFTLLLSGRFPNRSSLMEGAGTDLINSFYKGELEYLDKESRYSFYDIFPQSKLVQTNSDTHIINLQSISRFPTIMCRSIDARQVGLSEASNLLYLDDCVEGREEGKNRARLDEKWEVLSGDVIGRALEGTPIVIAGTRYSLYDPIGRLQDEAEKQGKKWRKLEIPALDPDTDESNFEYFNHQTGKWTFTTEFFKQQRDSLTSEQWESEFQQHPIEESGVLFSEKQLNRFYELPVNSMPDAVIAVCDTADGHGDSVCLLVAYVYGQDIFIVDCVFSSAAPEHTRPQCVQMLLKHNVQSALFESNKAGEYFARDIEKELRERGGICAFRTKYTTTNKQTRIEYASENILKHFWFLDKSKYTGHMQYGKMLKELCAYTRNGKVEHDDAADCMSLLENELHRTVFPTVEVRQRRYF